jgi:hypothetical protein
VKKLEPFHTVGRKSNGKQSTAPQKVKQKVTMWFSKSTPRHIPKRIKNIYLHKNMHTTFIIAKM